MKRTWFAAMAALVLAFAAAAAGAQSRAVLTGISGKVEIQNPGQTLWQPATEGMEVPVKATISTGFDGRAVLKLGASTVAVRPLTRLRIDELTSQNNVTKTSLAMPVGRIRAEVKSADGSKNDFTVKSALSTAAVRGTGFETDGVHLTCFESSVYFVSQSGIGINVHSGESGETSGGGAPSGGAGQQEHNTGVDTNPSQTGAGGLGGGPGQGAGTITVNYGLPS